MVYDAFSISAIAGTSPGDISLIVTVFIVVSNGTMLLLRLLHFSLGLSHIAWHKLFRIIKHVVSGFPHAEIGNVSRRRDHVLRGSEKSFFAEKSPNTVFVKERSFSQENSGFSYGSEKRVNSHRLLVDDICETIFRPFKYSCVHFLFPGIKQRTYKML